MALLAGMEGCVIGQVHYGSATTTAAVRRRTIQHRRESLRVLAKRYGINQKTVAKKTRQIKIMLLPLLIPSEAEKL